MKVTRLTVIPLKGLGAHHPEEITVTATGIRGDRQLFLVDDSDRLFSCTRTGAFYGLRADYDVEGRRLRVGDEEGPIELGAPLTASFIGSRKVSAREVIGPWSEMFSRLAERPLRLAFADEPNGGCDEYPLTVLGVASTEELARRSGMSTMDGRRFRMSIEFDGAAPHAEDAWKDVGIGDVVVRVRGPVPRCAATTRHPDRGDADLKTLHLLKAARDNTLFGVYAEVVTPGTIRLGDPLR
ncbi:MOSC domain-containing protein [Virgisporangium aurantiacum]|uniref:Molybdenum cofactor sulfurase n=1 Tax=Virgisporangium aurantiacum TaxID=175570 RepID=A0A8J3Z498_9ACTN|nr:MOSC domain-containing protein [Virgisporangium aurantiacum]GIJ56122.1 molybdenum cofactor sulfurase [Virgisporangium aurantiacum]